MRNGSCFFLSALLVLSSSAFAFEPGDIQWQYPLTDACTDPALGHDGTIYQSDGNELLALRPDGTLKWRFEADSDLGRPTVDEAGNVYVAYAEGVYALDSAGNTVWPQPSAPQLVGSDGFGTGCVTDAAVHDSAVYVAEAGGDALHAIDTITGIPKWRRNRIRHAPAFGPNGANYILSASHSLCHIELNDGSTIQCNTEIRIPDRARLPTLASNGNILVNGRYIVRAYGPDLVQVWNLYHGGGPGDNGHGQPIIDRNGTIYLGYAGHAGRGFYALNPDGTVRWHLDSDLLRDMTGYELTPSPSGTPVVGNDGVLYVPVQYGLIAIDTAKAAYSLEDSFLWRADLWDSSSRFPVMGSNGTIYMTGRGDIFDDQTDQEYLYAIATASTGPARSSWPMGGANAQRTNEAFAGFARRAGLLDPNWSAAARDGTLDLAAALSQPERSLATGIAADGDSLGLIVVPVDPQTDSVIIDLPAGEEAGTLYSYAGFDSEARDGDWHEQPSVTSLTIPAPEFEQVNGQRYALAVLRAPAMSTTILDDPIRIIIDQRMGAQTLSQQPLFITPWASPLLTIHGIWPDEDTWEDFHEALEDDPYRPVVMDSVDYRKYNSFPFDDDKVHSTLRNKLAKVLRRARRAGVIATRVDVIGHSMGGLVTRHHTTTNDYRGSENYRQGNLNRLLTVDTPHRGTPLADWLYEHRNALPELDCNYAALMLMGGAIGGTFSQIPLHVLMEIARRDIRQGAIEALRESGAAIEDLNDAATDLDYRAVVGVAPFTSELERFLSPLMSCYDSTLFFSSAIDTLLGAQHDVIVPGPSQQAGATATATIPGVIHTTVTDSPSTHALLLCWLQENADCSVVAARALPQRKALGDSLLDKDLSTWTEQPASTLAFTPAAGTVLSAGSLQSVEVSAPSKTLTGAVFLHDGQLHEDSSAPFTLDLVPQSLADAEVFVLGLFDDQSYAVAGAIYPVSPAGAVTELRVDDEMVLYRDSSPQSLRVEALYEGSNRPVDVTAQASYHVLSGSSAVITVSAQGEITPQGVGEDIVEIGYEGRIARVTVTVIASTPVSNVILEDGFEGP